MERQLPDTAAERVERSPGVWKEELLTESKGVSTCGQLSAGYTQARALGCWLGPCPEQGGAGPLLVS